MKKKSFERYLEKRLDKKEIAAIEEAAKIEIMGFRAKIVADKKR